MTFLKTCALAVGVTIITAPAAFATLAEATDPPIDARTVLVPNADGPAITELRMFDLDLAPQDFAAGSINLIHTQTDLRPTPNG